LRGAAAAAELLLTKTLKTESPPLPPAEPDATEDAEEGAASELIEDKATEAVEVKPKVEFTTEPAKSIEPAKPAMTFSEFWLAFGQTGREGYARARWGKLTATDKAAGGLLGHVRQNRLARKSEPAALDAWMNAQRSRTG
jgi:hypothetical protein